MRKMGWMKIRVGERLPSSGLDGGYLCGLLLGMEYGWEKMDAEKHHHPKWEGEEPLLLTALLLGAGLESSLEYGFEKGRTMDAFFLML
jgi:hypothetical protein